MPPRLRRAVAALGVLVFLGLWIWAAVTLGERVPDVWWAKVLFFGVAGTFWGIPILPLLSWAENGRWR